MIHVLVARDLRAARGTAEIDWGWRSIATDRWRRPDGAEVRYVSTAHRLYGYPRGGVTVHFGHAWHENPELQHLEELCLTMQYETRR